MNFSNFKIKTRLWMAFGATLLVMLAMVFVSASRLNTIAQKNKQILDKNAVSVSQALEIAALIQQNGRHTAELFITSQSNDRSKQYKQFDDVKKKSHALIESLRKLAETPQEKEALDKLTASLNIFTGVFGQVADLIELDSPDEAATMMEKVEFPALNVVTQEIAAIVKLQKEDMANSDAAIKSDIAFSRNLMLVSGVLATVISAIFAVLITNSITNALNAAIGVARQVADGDLTAKIEIKSRDETGALLSALADMNNSLVMTIGQVHNSAQTISSVSGEIAAGNSDLSSRTESQAESLEKTASSMEELTSTVKQNADNAKQANTLAISASNVAVKGGTVVGQVVTTMSSIKESSRKIVDIISVIDGIAFQTNILALNAAVEAARAGEQGRGFAVVATEVRNLAQRSSSAAKEIKTLIDDSVSKVDAGSKLVDDAGQTMDEIVTSIQHVADIMSEITAASQEQSAGIEEVNRAITQMDEITQQNAALVEQAAAAAESMQEQAAVLTQAVSVFKLNLPGNMQSMKASVATSTPAMENTSVKTAAAPKKLAEKVKPAPRQIASAASKSSINTKSLDSDDGSWEEF